MATKPVILTTEGHQKLEQELEQLKTVRRKEVSEKIKVALSFGDLSENSEYDLSLIHILFYIFLFNGCKTNFYFCFLKVFSFKCKK